jgi:mannitol/fructose-specific phosphotransferase system IIA component (Ntr-type)
MRILDILPRESIIAELRSKTKREVLEELAEGLLEQKTSLES